MTTLEWDFSQIRGTAVKTVGDLAHVLRHRLRVLDELRMSRCRSRGTRRRPARRRGRAAGAIRSSLSSWWMVVLTAAV
jgi:hypothetical protein